MIEIKKIADSTMTPYAYAVYSDSKRIVGGKTAQEAREIAADLGRPMADHWDTMMTGGEI